MSQAAWRRRVEAIGRIGLDYIDARRLENLTHDVGAELAPPETSPTTLIHEIQDTIDVARTDRLAALDLLRSEVAACQKCEELCTTRTQTVFSDGSPKAKLCFIGEAPGADEDLQGLPFVGKAGQLLTKIIEACGLGRDEVYICNILKCRPPGNRNPTPQEIVNCRPYLEQQLALVKPRMLVALGKFAAAHLLGEKPENVPITKLRGQIREYQGIPFMITLHPAYLLRNPPAKRDVWEDMKVVMREIGQPIVEKGGDK